MPTQQRHSHWGSYANAAALPNDAAEPNLEAGDRAYAIAEAATYTCTDATAGTWSAGGTSYDAQFTTLSEPTGFPNRTDTTLSFDDGTLTLTIAPVGATFDYWVEGVKHTVGTKTKAITNTEGLWFFYLDSSEVLQATQTFSTSILTENAICAIVYWDVSAAAHLILADERHGTIMDGITHQYLHEIFGAQWLSGGALGNFSVDQSGDVNAHAQFDCGSVFIADEDITFQFTDGSPQDLTPILQAPIFYLSGSGDWNKDAATTFPVKRFGASDRLAWNEFSGGTWSQTEVTNNDYVLCHIFATNDQTEPIIAVQGQADYNNIVSARQGATTELDNLITSGLPVVEWTPLGTVIYQTSDGYTNAVQARVVSTDEGADYVDQRAVQRASAGIASDHGNLAGLSDDDHVQYALLAGRDGDKLILADDTAGAVSPLSMTARTAAPTVPVNNDLYLFDDGSGNYTFKWYNGSWNSIGGGGGGGGGGVYTTALNYSYVEAATPIEEVMGALSFDGSTVSTSVKLVVNLTPTITLGNVTITLYDLGAVGSPAASRIVSQLTTSTSGGPQVLTQTITTAAVVASNDNKILAADHNFQITVTSNAQQNDTVYVGSARFEVS